MVAENIEARVAYKAYSTGVMLSNSEPAHATDPGATGAKTIRRVTANFDLTKDTFASNEIRTDRQQSNFRHGTRRGTGSLAGEWSPGTYQDLQQAVFRGTAVTTFPAISNTGYTSITAVAAASTITLGAGDAFAGGIRVGSIFRTTGQTQAANNGKNFYVTAMGGTNGRTLTVYPAPIDSASSATFTLTLVGGKLVNPSSGFVKRKFLFEVYHADVGVARIYTECRITGMQASLQPNGMATITFNSMGRNMKVLTGGAAPFFTNPSTETTTGTLAAPNGLLMIAGVVYGVITGLDFTVDLASEANPVVGQNFVPDIILGRFLASGTLNAYFENETMLNFFLNETEISLLVMIELPVQGGSTSSDAVTVLFPRIKLGQATITNQGEGGVTISSPFTALKASDAVTVAGLEPTTMQIWDTAFA